MANKHTREELAELQALPLSTKIALTKRRIREWIREFGEDGVYVSFSGGKDSTVLLHLVREEYPNVPAVFVDTGLEYPEIREFVNGFENVVWLKPKENFRKVIEKYGYPIVSKDVAQRIFDVRTQARVNGISIHETNLYRRNFDADSDYCKKFPTYCSAKYAWLLGGAFRISHMCCDIMKKAPAKEYEDKTGRKVMLATMTCESRFRASTWLRDGCNAFDSERPTSKPMSFWTEDDVLWYIKHFGIGLCSVYGDITLKADEDGQMSMYDFDDEPALYMSGNERPKLKTTGAYRTGCMFCMFGCMSKQWDNFERLKITHPKQYAYIMKPWSEGGLGYKEVIDWINENNGKGTIIRY